MCQRRNSCILVRNGKGSIFIVEIIAEKRAGKDPRPPLPQEKGKAMALLIFAFWMILNGRVTWETLGLGAALAALGMLFLCKACDWSPRREKQLYFALPRIVGYALTVIWEIVKANLVMCRVVYRGRPEPVVRTIHTQLKTRLGRMALANSITLTPGTITLSCRGDELTVHCLTPGMAEGLDQTVFERKLVKIEEALHGKHI